MSRFRLLTGKRDPWTPWVIPRSKLVGFVDFEVTARITPNGSAIAAYGDLINGASYAQVSGAAQPAIATNAITGRQEAYFSGAQYLDYTGIPTGLPTGANPGEIIAVLTQSAPVDDANGRTPVAYGAAATTGNRRIFRTGSTLDLVASVGDGSAAITSTLTGRFFGNHLCRTVANGTAIYAGLDGDIAQTVPCIPATGTTRLRIGCSTSNTPGSFFVGGISALLFINGLLTAAELAALLVWARPRITR